MKCAIFVVKVKTQYLMWYVRACNLFKTADETCVTRF